MFGRHPSGSMMNLGKFIKDTHCEPGEEKRGRGKESPVPTKMYQKTMNKNNF